MLAGWLYLGRRFGILPANRGLVRDFALVALSVPFMVWRIALEEELLDRDPGYLAYRERVRWRLAPGMF